MKISVLGCGWLGFPLAIELIKKGHGVRGATTSPEKSKKLAAENIEPYLVRFTPELENPKEVKLFWESEVLVVNIPPGRKRDNVVDFHTRQIRAVENAVANSSIKFVVFVSSTSVYPKLPGRVNERDAFPGKAGRDSGNALLEAEKILMENNSFETTIVRFGGLTGKDRNPVKHFAGRKGLSRGNAPVNMIHQKDCIAIIAQIIEEKIMNEIFNAVSDEHPTRKDYYTQAAKKLDLEPPTFLEDREKNHKLVNNEKLKSYMGYAFK